MKNPHARRHKAAREAEHAARDMARANGATDEQWAEAERLAVLAWPGQLEDFGSSPRAIAFMRAAWCAWLIDDRQAGTDAALRITQAMSGHPVDGHQIASVPKVDVDACIRSLGVNPFDVQAEAQNTLRTSAPWALIVALGGVADVASERCTANVRTSVATLLCGGGATAGPGIGGDAAAGADGGASRPPGSATVASSMEFCLHMMRARRRGPEPRTERRPVRPATASGGVRDRCPRGPSRSIARAQGAVGAGPATGPER